VDRIPSRVFRPLLDRPTCRPEPSSPEVSAPFNGILAPAPVWDGSFHPRPGSALRLSQPLSGLRQLEFHGLVSCRNRSWASPFRAFPSQRSCTPLEATGSPAVIHRRARHLCCAALSSPVSPTPTPSAQWPGSPDDYGLPFREPRPASRSSWTANVSCPFRQLHPLRSFAPPVSPFAPSPVARLGGRCSPGFMPLQSSLPDLGASDPAERTSSPLDRVRPPRSCEQERIGLSAASGLLRGRSAPALAGDSFSHGLRSGGLPPS
jgi:hypothetical protein